MYSGKILIEKSIESYKEALLLATSNALIAAESCLEKGEKISVILQLNVFLNAEQGFKAHAKIADYASNFLIEQLGGQCIGSRAAIGVATLPSDAPVEITLICAVV